MTFEGSTNGTPFNNPSVQPELAEMWLSVIRKSKGALQQQAAATVPATPTINFNFGGGGQALVAANADPLLVEIGYPMTIIWAHVYAGDANGLPVSVTATIDLQLTQLANFGASTFVGPVSLSGASTADMSIATWQQTSLITGDTLIARLSSFTGSATWLALVLLLRPTEVQLGLTTVVDGEGNTLVDSAGNVIVDRG